MMPYVTSFFMPRQAGDRPAVVPNGVVNFAFIGQSADSAERDCIFTTEYSVRTAMEAAYTLLNMERGVPEAFNSTYDVRKLLAAIGKARPTLAWFRKRPSWRSWKG
ncbi:myosin-crossreactive antigen [Bradyrhizobium diazoefficiens]